MPKKLSSRSEPVKRYGIESEMYVTIGMSALRRTCRVIITTRESPFDRAVRTYGLNSSSSIAVL